MAFSGNHLSLSLGTSHGLNIFLRNLAEKKVLMMNCWYALIVGILKHTNNSSSAPFNSNDIYQGVRSGDLLIHGMDTWHGAIAVSKFDGMCTPVVHVCDSSQNKEYVATYLRNMASQQIFKLISNGVRQNTSDFRSWDKLSRIPIPLPPLVEQEKIVSYLEDKTSKIDEVILAKEKQIKLLQELKDAEIANVITRGLNPDVKMKRYDSLLSSECPEHWCITRNKSFMSLVGEKVGRQSVSYTLLSLTTKGVIIRDVESGKGKFPKDFDTYQIVQRGELVFCLFDIDETPRTVGIVETGGMWYNHSDCNRFFTRAAGEVRRRPL